MKNSFLSVSGVFTLCSLFMKMLAYYSEMLQHLESL